MEGTKTCICPPACCLQGCPRGGYTSLGSTGSVYRSWRVQDRGCAGCAPGPTPMPSSWGLMHWPNPSSNHSPPMTLLRTTAPRRMKVQKAMDRTSRRRNQSRPQHTSRLLHRPRIRVHDVYAPPTCLSGGTIPCWGARTGSMHDLLPYPASATCCLASRRTCLRLLCPSKSTY